MAIKDSILNFIAAHTNLLADLEEMGIHEVISLLKTLYPQDVTLIAIVQKISDEVLKLQGITPPAQ